MRKTKPNRIIWSTVRVSRTTTDFATSFIRTTASIADAKRLAIAPIYSLLERPVERPGTMQALDKPVYLKTLFATPHDFCK
jgi:hypothetical protein